MSVISLTKVTKQYGTQIVLNAVSFTLNAGETLGVVGANGSGKTTLLRLISRETLPDSGELIAVQASEIGVLTQEPNLRSDRTLHDEVGSVFEHLLALEDKLHQLSEKMSHSPDEAKLAELMGQYDRTNEQFIAAGGHTFETRLKEILGGLGFQTVDYTLPIKVLSGGQKCRASLAKLLLQERRVLLLDEPTNHLDIDASTWLEKFLKDHRGEAILISHDRYLLDRLCDRIVEVEHSILTSYAGNYSKYADTKQLRLLTEERQFVNDAAFIKKEREFIAKHISGQRTKEAQGRRTRLERRLKAGEFVTDKTRQLRSTKLNFQPAIKSQEIIIRCEDLAMGFDGRPLFEGLSFLIQPGTRLGITGSNGIGKTTLLKILLDQLTPTSGKITFAPKLRIGYHAQEHNAPPPELTIIEDLRTVQPQLSELQARNILARFLFRGDDVFKPLAILSGGEQSRVRLVKLILEGSDVLILDEPTNHLDIPSCEALEESLTEFTGTILVVSHDRYFLDRVANRMLVMRKNDCRIFEGNYSSYLEQIEAEKQKALDLSGKSRPSKNSRKKLAKDKPKTPVKKTSPYDSQSIDELETLVVDYETQLADLQGRFGEPAIMKDPDALARLREDIEEVESKLKEVDDAWQERVEYQG